MKMLFHMFIVGRITVELYSKIVKEKGNYRKNASDLSSLLATNVNNVAGAGNLRVMKRETGAPVHCCTTNFSQNSTRDNHRQLSSLRQSVTQNCFHSVEALLSFLAHHCYTT